MGYKSLKCGVYKEIYSKPYTETNIFSLSRNIRPHRASGPALPFTPPQLNRPALSNSLRVGLPLPNLSFPSAILDRVPRFP